MNTNPFETAKARWIAPFGEAVEPELGVLVQNGKVVRTHFFHPDHGLVLSIEGPGVPFEVFSALALAERGRA